MNTRILACALCAAALGTSAGAENKVYPNRWVRIGTNLRDDRELERVREIVRTASAHGLTGIALSAGLDRLDLQPPDYGRRLQELKKTCDGLKVKIIPSFMSAGYGGAVLAHDKNLAAGLPVKDALFVVKGGEAGLRRSGSRMAASRGAQAGGSAASPCPGVSKTWSRPTRR